VKTKKSQVFQKPLLCPKPIRVDIRNSQKDLSISERSVRLLVLDILKELDVSCDEIAVHFVTAHSIAKLHKIYFDDPTPTDTISFPLDVPGSSPNCHLGEVLSAESLLSMQNIS
jgi:probable rRNA maturation factor